MTVRGNTNVARRLLLCGMMFVGMCDTMPARAQTSDIVKRSSIIFVGTVVKLGAVSFEGVLASKKTAVVKVDRVIEKPAAIVITGGQQVTVELKDPSKFNEGTQPTFYTQGWILGQGTALKEVGHEVTPVTLALQPGQVEKHVALERQKQQEEELRARIKSADMVVAGRVVSVRQAATATGGKKFITEHDPNWQEATIKVESAMKGASGVENVVVRFPGSEDVLYYDLPKFKADQEGVFLLKKDVVTGLPKAMMGTAEVDAYVAQKPVDLLPKADTSRVMRLMKRK